MTYSVLGLTLDGWAALNLLVQFILPLLVGLVTTRLTGRHEQALLLASLTLVATVATQGLSAHATGQPFNPEQVILVAVVNFIVSTGAHYGLWKPTGLSGLLLALFSQPVPAVTAVPSVPVPDPSAPLSPASPVPALTLVPRPVDSSPKHAA